MQLNGARKLITKFQQNHLNQYIKKFFIQRKRDQFEVCLKKNLPIFPKKIKGPILVDATWDNPNYWFRYALLRSALGFTDDQQVGILGEWRNHEQKRTLKKFGVNQFYNISTPDGKEDLIVQVEEIIKKIKDPDDLLKIKLDFNLPNGFLYDYILKRQRRAFVDIESPLLSKHILSFLYYLRGAQNAIKKFNPELVLSSHTFSTYSPLVWVALSNQKKVVIPFGDLGTLRFWNIPTTDKIYDFMSFPAAQDINSMQSEKKEKLEQIGISYLKKRMSGQTDNLGASFAYAANKEELSKQEILNHFSWSDNKKIIALYSSNWFDYPHFLGMSHFRDFYDWIISSLEVMKKSKNYYWLLKGHPSDAWYKGITLNDLVKDDLGEHIKLVPESWKGSSLLAALDGVITYHGTIGVEATIQSKPVLVADRGWYDTWGFVKKASSREHYLELLTQQWWQDMDIELNAKNAKIFAGAYWGRPTWQKEFLFQDDSHQWKIYETAPQLIQKNKIIIEKEIETLRSWYESSYPHYHSYKILKADDYIA